MKIKSSMEIEMIVEQNRFTSKQNETYDKTWVSVDDLLTFIEVSTTSSEDYEDMSDWAKGYIDAFEELKKSIEGKIK